MSHKKGVNNPEIHKLAFTAFMEATKISKEQGLYGAGQDLLKTSFSGNVRGMGPGVAEMEFEERPSEAVMVLASDKTEPGMFNLPLYYAFVEASRSPGLILSKDMRKGVEFTIMDAKHTKADKIIKLKTPEEYLEIASLLWYTHRFVIASIHSRSTGEQIVAASTTRLHNISGVYSGKDDVIALVRLQKPFLATEEVGAMFKYAPYVAGDTRGSHNLALMPVKLNSPSSTFYCNPIISGLYFSMHNGKFTAFGDAFDDPIFDEVRRIAAQKSFFMRENGFVMPSMLGIEEIEYTELKNEMKKLEKRFFIRK